MSGAFAEVQMILDLYGETDVFIDNENECPECEEFLDQDGWCPNGCLDDMSEDFEDEDYDEDDEDDLTDVRAGVDYSEDYEGEYEGYVR